MLPVAAEIETLDARAPHQALLKPRWQVVDPYDVQRASTVLLAFAVVVTACSSNSDQQVGTGTSLTTTAPLPSTTATPADATLDPAEALLAEDDVPAPWDLTGEGDFDGYDIGPDQADCEPYWSLQRLSAHPIRSRLWFQPGANLDHDVFDTGAPAAQQYLAAADAVPEACPLITWNEGGTLATEHLDLGIDDVVAVAYTSDIGEVEWYAYTTRANLVSRLRYVHFGSEPGQRPPPPADAQAEFAELVTRMVQRLAAATSADPPATSADPPATSADPPAASTTTSTTALLPAPGSPQPSLDQALLSVEDLPEGYRETRTGDYDSAAPNGEWIPGCDPSRVINEMNGWFTLERLFSPDDAGPRPEVQHLLGRAPTKNAARAAVASVGSVADCDLSADVTLSSATLAGGVVPDGSGGLATYLRVERPEQDTGGLIVAYHAHDVIGVLVLTVERGDAAAIDDYLPTLRAAAARAVAL